MIESLHLEALNASFATVSLCALAILLIYMWKNLAEGYQFLRPAIAMAFFWAGESWFRGIFAYSRHLINAGIPDSQPEISTILAGNLWLIIAVLCYIRVFSPLHWGHWPWVTSLVVTTIVAAIFVYT